MSENETCAHSEVMRFAACAVCAAKVEDECDELRAEVTLLRSMLGEGEEPTGADTSKSDSQRATKASTYSPDKFKAFRAYHAAHEQQVSDPMRNVRCLPGCACRSCVLALRPKAPRPAEASKSVATMAGRERDSNSRGLSPVATVGDIVADAVTGQLGIVVSVHLSDVRVSVGRRGRPRAWPSTSVVVGRAFTEPQRPSPSEATTESDLDRTVRDRGRPSYWRGYKDGLAKASALDAPPPSEVMRDRDGVTEAQFNRAVTWLSQHGIDKPEMALRRPLANLLRAEELLARPDPPRPTEATKEPGAKRCHVKCNNVAGCVDEPQEGESTEAMPGLSATDLALEHEIEASGRYDVTRRGDSK